MAHETNNAAVVEANEAAGVVMVEQVKRNNRVFVIVDGKEIARKDWAIDKFSQDMKRGDIAKMLGVPVQTVFGYTRDLTNAVHHPGKGGFGGASKVMVTNPLTGEEDSRANVIRALYEGGMPRGEIAKKLECSYQAVYAVTKKLDAPEVPVLDEDVSADGVDVFGDAVDEDENGDGAN